MYVPLVLIEKAQELGWENPQNLGPPHNNYSVLMEWTKDNEPIMPMEKWNAEKKKLHPL